MSRVTWLGNVAQWGSVVASVTALIFSSATAYYTVVKRDERVSVVFDGIPVFEPIFNLRRVEVDGGFDVLLINSGAQPVAIMGFEVHLSESTSRKKANEVGNWQCHRDAAHRSFKAKFDAFVVKEKEIVRKHFPLSIDEKSGQETKMEGEKITFPMPSWFSEDSEYWNSLCISIAVSTPSTAFNISSVELAPQIGIVNKVSRVLGGRMNPVPHVIWHKLGTIFSD